MSSADESNHKSQPDLEPAAAELPRGLLFTSVELPGFEAYSAEFSFASDADAVVARCAGVSYEPVARVHSDRIRVGIRPERRYRSSAAS